MIRVGQLSSFAPMAIAALLGLAGVAFGDNIILPPVRVDDDAAKMATQSYKFCWAAMREVNGMMEDNFFAEPIVESNGHKGGASRYHPDHSEPERPH